MSAAFRVARPTEGAAVYAASRSRRSAPSIPSLFKALRLAQATRDRYGVRLMQHAIARALARAEAAR